MQFWLPRGPSIPICEMMRRRVGCWQMAVQIAAADKMAVLEAWQSG
jgi:hypothetical protein